MVNFFAILWVFSHVRDGMNISQLSFESKISYAYCNILVKELVSLTYITIEKSGREMILHLTKQGNSIQETTQRIVHAFPQLRPKEKR